MEISIFFLILEMLERNLLPSTNYEEGSATMTNNFQYTDEFESRFDDSAFARNSHLRASSAGCGAPPSTTPLRTLNNNHYANLQVNDPITYNLQKPEDKKSLFKVPFPTSFKGNKSSNSLHVKNGAGPLTKPPPSFLQPKSKYTTNALPEQPSHQAMYQDSTTHQIYYQGKTTTNLFVYLIHK